MCPHVPEHLVSLFNALRRVTRRVRGRVRSYVTMGVRTPILEWSAFVTIIVLDRSVGGQRVGWALQGWVRSIKLVFCSVYATQDSCPLSKTVAKGGKAALPVPAPADELSAQTRFRRLCVTHKCAEHMLGVQNLAQVHAKRLARFLLCSGRVMIVILRVLFKNRAMDVSADVSADAWTGPVCPGSPRQAPSEGE